MVVSVSTVTNLYRIDFVHRVLSSPVIFKSYHTCAHIARRIISHALQYHCADRMHFDHQGKAGAFDVNSTTLDCYHGFIIYQSQFEFQKGTQSQPSTERLPKKSVSNANFDEVSEQHQVAHEHTLRNTFGWTRIDILTMLIVCILLAALCFSLLVEAIQTLIHIDHQDTMHHPLAVIIVGAVGLLLNGLAFLLIGGYTSHQCSFLQITPGGDVVLDRITSENLRDSKRSYMKTKRDLGSGGSIRALPATTKSFESMQQKTVKTSKMVSEMVRDICSKSLLLISISG